MSAAATAPERFALLLRELATPDSARVLVVAHRAGYLRDWEYQAPENSLAAIRNGIALGFDALELDVRQTKDKRFVLVHESRLERVTDGGGFLQDLTWDELAQRRLMYRNGQRSEHRVATLEEALSAARGGALLKLHPKFPVERFAELREVLLETGTLEQALVWIDWRPGEPDHEAVQALFAKRPELLEMRILANVLDTKEVRPALKALNPAAVEFSYEAFAVPDFDAGALETIRSAGARVAVNCMGRAAKGEPFGDRAVQQGPEKTSGWKTLVERGARMLQINHPEDLRACLLALGLTS
ncbi:MAG: glycerophosphodiester phosphodiesterase family protein [Planctomycetes bacterium]|nr:glycerophosphodiester phosphodiesterase family protein [Planctomycetota bacterium]